MIDENLARLRARRNNVHRYRRLLATQLTDLERAYINQSRSDWLGSAQSAGGRESIPCCSLISIFRPDRRTRPLHLGGGGKKAVIRRLSLT
jgi:hypothetical protein